MKNNLFPAIRRRDFLALGSTCFLSSLFLGSGLLAGSRAFKRLISTDPRADEPLSVGYWRGSEGLADMDHLIHTSGSVGGDARTIPTNFTREQAPFRPDLIAAEALSVGDLRFARAGARVWIHGMFPLEDRRTCSGLDSLSIDVDFSPFHTTPFHAWHFQNASVPDCSSPSMFVVPIDKASGLTFSVEVTEVADMRGEAPRQGGRQVRAQFTLGREPGKLKLRRGVYFIGLRSVRTGSLPAWDKYQLRVTDMENAGAKRYLFRFDRRQIKLVPADFVYLMLSVDYAQGDSAVQT